MIKNKKHLLCLIAIITSFISSLCLGEDIGKIPAFTKNDNILILAPHPDDEAIAMAGVIQKALKTGAKIKIVLYTNGDNNEPAFIIYEKRLTFRKGEFIHMGEVRRKETIEEMGINLSNLDYSSFVYMVDERETGQVSFAAIAKNTDHCFVLERYEADTKTRLAAGERLEVDGLANLPVAGVALVPLEEKMGIQNITCYKPTAQGLVETVEDRVIRPYTQATLDYLTKPRNVKFLLEKAGF